MLAQVQSELFLKQVMLLVLVPKVLNLVKAQVSVSVEVLTQAQALAQESVSVEGLKLHFPYYLQRFH